MNDASGTISGLVLVQLLCDDCAYAVFDTGHGSSLGADGFGAAYPVGCTAQRHLLLILYPSVKPCGLNTCSLRSECRISGGRMPISCIRRYHPPALMG